MKRFIAIVGAVFSITFFSWAIVNKLHVNNLSIQSEDTVPALFVPLAVLKEHTLYLDKYYPMMLHKYPQPDDKKFQKGTVPFYIKKVGPHYLSAFPIITPLLAIPIYAIALGMGVSFDWTTLATLGHITGALIIALSTYLFYLLVKKLSDLPERRVLVLTFLYAFGTVNFAMISQGLWQHGTVELFTIAALLFAVNYLKSHKDFNLLWFGLLYGFAILSRPTALLSFGLFSVYLVWSKDFIRRSLYIFTGTIIPLLFFFWYNNTYYLSITNQGYSGQLTRNWLGDFPLSFFGVWVSPSKGILIFSPIFVFSLAVIFNMLRKRISVSPFFVLTALVVFLHTLIISFWKHWFGGWSFGYRMSSDVIPFMALLLIPWLETASARKYKAFLILAVVSVVMEFYGIAFFDGIWHAAYDRGFEDTRWLWSVKDSQMSFDVRRVLVKVGLLDRACPTCTK